MKFKRTFFGLSVASYTMRLNTVVVAVGDINLKKFSVIKVKDFNGLAWEPTIDKISLGSRGN